MARLTDSEWKVMEALWQGGPQTLGRCWPGWRRTPAGAAPQYTPI